ncbi:MAG TPA: hypothetical protein VKD04_07415 [Burkholderiales bacterium]|nr:hypothetical protein [Burkholderiales bacterium]
MARREQRAPHCFIYLRLEDDVFADKAADLVAEGSTGTTSQAMPDSSRNKATVRGFGVR